MDEWFLVLQAGLALSIYMVRGPRVGNSNRSASHSNDGYAATKNLALRGDGRRILRQ